MTPEEIAQMQAYQDAAKKQADLMTNGPQSTDEFWKREQQNYGGGKPGASQGDTSSGTWGWLTGSGTKNWTPDPSAYINDPNAMPDWARQRVDSALAGVDPNAANIEAARGLQGTGRSGLLGALQSIQGRPLQSEALGQALMKQGQQQVAANAASQLASLPGRYNPAAVRQAQNIAASAGQNMALQAHQQALSSAIAEQSARDQAVLGGYGNLDANDIRRLVAEQGQRSGDQGSWAKQQEVAQGWQGMGLAQQAQADLQKRAYEQAKMQGFYGNQQQGDPTGQELVKGAAQIAAAYVTKSDVRAKQNIRPAEPDFERLSQMLADHGQATYDYRKGQRPAGRKSGAGPMTQDLEQAGPVGRSMVAKDQDGTGYIRGDAAITALLGVAGQQQQQINELREALGQGGGSSAPRRTKARQAREYASTLEAIGIPSGAPQGQTASARQMMDMIEQRTGRWSDGTPKAVYDQRLGEWVNQADPVAVARAFPPRSTSGAGPWVPGDMPYDTETDARNMAREVPVGVPPGALAALPRR